MLSRALYSGVALLSLAASAMADFDFSPVSKDMMDELLGVPPKRGLFDEDEAVSLKAQDHLFWAAKTTNRLVYANMTLNYPEETANFVSMDQFRPMVQKVVCGENMAIEFKNRNGLEKARRAWNWVNDETGHQMYMLTNWPGCGTPGRREPWEVTDITYDTRTNTARLKSTKKPWPEVAHTYHLSVRHAPLPQSSLRIRDDPDFSFKVGSSFNQELFNHTLGGYYISAACTDCGSTGEFDINGDWDIDGFSLSSASLTISPRDVSAFLALYGSVGVGGVPGVGYAWRHKVAEVPVGTWNPIPEIVQLGPYVSLDVGFKIGKVSGGMEFATGARMDLSNDAYATVDFIGDKSGYGGWTPEFTTAPTSVNAHITAHSEVYIILAAELKADINTLTDSYGYVAELDLKMPYVGADITYVHDEDGTCSGNTEDSVSIVANLGVELDAQASKSDDTADPIIQYRLYETHTPLWSTCIGFGGAPQTFSNITSIPAPTGTLPPGGGNGSNGSDSNVVMARATPVNHHDVRGYYKGRPVKW